MRFLGAIRAHDRPHGIVLRRYFAQRCSGNQVRVPCLGAAAYYSLIRSVPGNDTTFPEPYNMPLWKDLFRINGLILRIMHHIKGIRASYAVCICRQKVIAGSVAAIHCFHCIFGMKKMAVIYHIPWSL